MFKRIPPSLCLVPIASGLFLLGSGTLYAWWDTRLEVVRPPSLLQELPATTASLVAGVQVEDDPHANGGSGGKVLRLSVNEGPLSINCDLQPGLYAWQPIVRIDGEAKIATLLFSLTVTPVNAPEQAKTWVLPGKVGSFYGGSPRFYVPIAESGTYTFSLRLLNDIERLGEAYPTVGRAWSPVKRNAPPPPEGLEGISRIKRFEKSWALLQSDVASTQSVLIDRIELRSPLAGRSLQQTKQARNLSKERALDLVKTHEPVRRVLLGDSERVWAELPDFNAISVPGGSYGPLIGTALSSLAQTYLEEGDPAVAAEGALLLCGLAERWPAIDYQATALDSMNTLMGGHGSAPWRTSAGNTIGKHVYRGWSGKPARILLGAYDVFFDHIKDNEQLAAFLSTKIPGIKTPADVVAMLDERLLWVTAEQVRRGVIGDDEAAIASALVWGVGPEADRILNTTTFDRIHRDMAHQGSIDDQAVTAFTRDGLSYIGAVSYYNTALAEGAEMLEEYRKAGGAERFRLMGTPGGRGAEFSVSSLEALNVSGGFNLVQGDGADLRRGRIENAPAPKPSRVLGGNGFTILESGQFGDNPLKMRAVGFTWGPGRGHAHSDTLNFELFAHGARISPDLGGRQEGPRKGYPNMRSNRAHNIVEVDGHDFINTNVSIVPATGWLVSFAPAEGAAFAEHGARASSHPQVTHYGRQSALIDIPGADGAEESYLFDVMRVAGGKEHSYHFHGMPSHDLVTNVTLGEVTGQAEADFLKVHKEGTKRQGVAGELVEAQWTLDESQPQAKPLPPGRMPSVRLSLHGSAGGTVLVGNGYSDFYKYDFPFFYTQHRGAEKLESVFPSIVEPFVGKPFLTSRRMLKVTPEARDALRGVALQVQSISGRTDLLYASGRPEEKVAVPEAKAEFAGRFGFIGADKEGVEQAHLAGGTLLQTPQLLLRTPQGRSRTTITAIDYPQRLITLSEEAPELVPGSTITIHNGNFPHAFTVEARDGKQLRLRESPLFFQSTVNRVEGKIVTGDLPPASFGFNPAFVERTVLSTEGGTRFWRVERLEPQEYRMHIGYPGYRWSFPNRVTLEDFPDLDGDGHRMLTLRDANLERTDQERALPEPHQLKVTRVSEDGETLYYRTEAGQGQDNPAWGLDGVLMENEAGRKFYSRYPGVAIGWIVNDEVAPGDFTDADGDGRVKMQAYLFGTGDRVEADTAVALRRVGPHRYRLQASTALEIGFPADQYRQIAVSTDEGKTFTPHAGRREGNYLIIQLNETGGKCDLLLVSCQTNN